MSLRGKTIQLYDKNPYVPDRSDQVWVRIKNIPLSVDDSIIVKSLKDNGCELTEDPSREKLRVDGKLTNCETGDRIAFIKPLKEPLPKVMKIGLFRAVIAHPGQTTSTQKQHCGKCLQDTHRTMECMNDWVCRRCSVSGHKSGDCPMTSQSADSGIHHESEKQPEAEKEQVLELDPKVQPEPEPKPPTSTAGKVVSEKSTQSPTGRKSRDRNHKRDKQSSKDKRLIQDYFKTSVNTPLKSGEQKLSVVHSPPTPIERQSSQKKTKIRDKNGHNDSESTDSESEHGLLL